MNRFIPSRIGIRFEHELLAILGLSLPLIMTIYLIRISALRIILGAPYVLFFPGYTLVMALFPGRDDLDVIERLGLSLGLSIAVLPLMGLILNYTPFGITVLTTLGSAICFMVGATAVAYHRRGKLAPEEQFVVRLDLDLTEWQAGGLIDRSLTAALAISIALALGTFLFVLAKPEVGERFTEFYILGPKRTAEDYRTGAFTGESIMVIVGVVNHEHANSQYRIEKDVDGQQVEEIAQIQLAHEEKWEERFIFSLPEPGADQKVSFVLYRQGQEEPYRSVHLWIDVLPRSVPLTYPTPSPAAAPALVPTSTPAMPATAEASPSIIATAAATSTSTPSPTPSPTTAATAVPTSTPTVSPTAEVGGTPEGRIIHIVQAGETVDAIARQYGVTRDAIVYVNGLEDPSLIYVGQELIIPGPDEVLPTSTPAPP